MTRFGTILVATDGSDDSDAAVEAALDLAHDTNGKLLVLSVVPEASGDGSEEGAGSDEAAEPPARDEDEEVIEAARRHELLGGRKCARPIPVRPYEAVSCRADRGIIVDDCD